MKKCSYCGRGLPNSEFPKGSTRCKKCTYFLNNNPGNLNKDKIQGDMILKELTEKTIPETTETIAKLISINSLKIQIALSSIPINLLKIAAYQKNRLNLARAKKISSEYDPIKIGVILVSFREGVYYIMDGQHRVVASKLKGIKDMICEVVTGLSYEEEAKYFAEQKKNTKDLSTVIKFNALVESKEKIALDIKEIIESSGFEISESNGAGKVRCIAKIESIYAKFGREIFIELFDVLSKSWSTVSNSIPSSVFGGIAIFLKENKNIDKRHLINVLSKIDPLTIDREGKSDLTKHNNDDGARKSITTHYNKRAKNKI